MKTPAAVSAYLSTIGSKGGKKGKRADKVRAGKLRWKATAKAAK